MSKIDHKVLIVGATGFTGQRVMAQIAQYNRLATQKGEPRILPTVFLRDGRSPPEWDGDEPILIARGDLDDGISLQNALDGKSGLIYAASLGFGHGPEVVRLAEEAGVKRAVFISTTAIFTHLPAATKKPRVAAEAAISASKLNWTLLRPTMIYGRQGDRNMERLVGYLKKFPVIFAPGRVDALQQPVHVDDVARAVVQVYFNKNTLYKAYNISGAQALPFHEIVAETAAVLGKKRLVVPVPLAPCRFALRLYAKLVNNPALKEEQLLRLNEDKAFDNDRAVEDFNYDPLPFADGIRRLVEELEANEKTG